jgi:signal transduction histidine kinase
VESKHGGEIALQSSPQGTEFIVYLPINGGSESMPEAVAPATTAKDTQATTSR